MSGKMYQVQNGQKVDITPQVATLSTGTRRNVGELVYSLVPLDDAGLHLLDGSLIATTGVYAEGAAAIIALRPNHPYLFTSETMWQQSVSQYGVCGKFVYDAGAGTLRLPKITGFVEGTLDATALGDLVEAGLPNITGWFVGVRTDYSPPTSGSFFIESSAGDVNPTTPGGQYYIGKRNNFDASRSDPTYGNSTTVQPQAIKGYLYMVLANRPKTPIQVDIDNIAADLALKADVSLGNVNSAGATAMAHAAMPSNERIILSLTSPGNNVGANWTAPTDGYLTICFQSNAPTQTAWSCFLGKNDSHPVAYSGGGIGQIGLDIWLTIPLSAGQTASFNNLNAPERISCFTYCNGSAPQP